MTEAKSFKSYDSGVEPREDVVLRAKAALEGITEGSWEARHEYKELTRVVHTAEAEWTLFVCCDCGVEAGALNSRDAEFIAATRSLVPELVAEVERLRNLVASLEVGQGNAGVLLAEAAEQYDRIAKRGTRR